MPTAPNIPSVDPQIVTQAVMSVLMSMGLMPSGVVPAAPNSLPVYTFPSSSVATAATENVTTAIAPPVPTSNPIGSAPSRTVSELFDQASQNFSSTMSSTPVQVPSPSMRTSSAPVSSSSAPSTSPFPQSTSLSGLLPSGSGSGKGSSKRTPSLKLYNSEIYFLPQRLFEVPVKFNTALMKIVSARRLMIKVNIPATPGTYGSIVKVIFDAFMQQDVDLTSDGVEFAYIDKGTKLLLPLPISMAKFDAAVFEKYYSANRCVIVPTSNQEDPQLQQYFFSDQGAGISESGSVIEVEGGGKNDEAGTNQAGWDTIPMYFQGDFSGERLPVAVDDEAFPDDLTGVHAFAQSYIREEQAKWAEQQVKWAAERQAKWDAEEKTAAKGKDGSSSALLSEDEFGDVASSAGDTNETRQSQIQIPHVQSSLDGGLASYAPKDVSASCFCGDVDEEKNMIMCEAHEHEKWFHFICVDLLKSPKGRWKCDACKREKRPFSSSSSRGSQTKPQSTSTSGKKRARSITPDEALSTSLSGPVSRPRQTRSQTQSLAPSLAR
ncbi:hypothetical protein CF327_g7355 [Tilletia walkeri]|nr:hypothetical protein CF327_g7355 [Tilletia walkeri]